MGILLKNVLITLNEELVNRDVLVENGVIRKIEVDIEEKGNTVIELKDKLLTPGLIDLHVHLREPGGEHKETIETGTNAAARGGFTTIAPMPNTRPVPDNKEQMEWLQNRIQETASVRVLPYAAITKRQIGKELNDFKALKEAGAFAFTDDGVGVQSANMMLSAMKKAAALDMAIVAHCEEDTLINKGCVHEGEFSKREELNGIPSVCEAVHIARDVLLAEAANVHYHVCHISTKESVRVVRDAKRAGIKVTAEVTPHHLLLCEDDIPSLDANYKMNPPLRSKVDQDALIEGLLDGTIDFIATDHAPHSEEEKAIGMELAPFGIVGLETAFPLLYTNLVEKKICTLEFLIDRLTKVPAALFKLPYGELKEGQAADLAVFDIQTEEPIDIEQFVSKGKNTPFNGWKCKGWTVLTMVDGKIVYEKETTRV